MCFVRWKVTGTRVRVGGGNSPGEVSKKNYRSRDEGNLRLSTQRHSASCCAVLIQTGRRRGARLALGSVGWRPRPWLGATWRPPIDASRRQFQNGRVGPWPKRRNDDVWLRLANRWCTWTALCSGYTLTHVCLPPRATQCGQERRGEAVFSPTTCWQQYQTTQWPKFYFFSSSGPLAAPSAPSAA